MTDHQWLGDTAERYYREIYCYLRRHVDSDDTAYELTQTVFLRLCECYRTFDRARVRAWLYRVAKNVCADHYREKYHAKQWDAEIPAEQFGDILGQTDASLSQVEFVDALNELLEQLTETERQLFCDRFQRELPYEVIAEQQKLTAAAVRKRYSRLHKKLIKYIKILFVFCSP